MHEDLCGLLLKENIEFHENKRTETSLIRDDQHAAETAGEERTDSEDIRNLRHSLCTCEACAAV